MSDKTKTLNEQWHQLVKSWKLDRPEVNDIQRLEMKRSFFAGATCMLSSNLEAAEMEDEDEAAARMGRYLQEIRGFNEAVKLGAA